ncbi:response regulator transcription factor [Sulfitobacter aestuarii]|uniref:Response regulator transcription factor n=1 Tax=Sulfitobacter aestuarii TaxID=2161676 RepID=A0ABW5TZX0_9RHOB
MDHEVNNADRNIDPCQLHGQNVVLLGSVRHFPNRMLQVFSAEFEEADFQRIADVAALQEIGETRAGADLTIVDEDFVDDILTRPQFYIDAAAPGRLVLAYRDCAVAQRLLAEKSVRTELSEIGFLPLNVQIDVWLSVMRLLLCGEVVYPQALLRGRDGAPVEATAEPCDKRKLTTREWEILTMVATGKQNKVIASDLELSEHTVKLHVHHILRKLGVSNRTGAATWFSLATGEAPGGADGAALS